MCQLWFHPQARGLPGLAATILSSSPTATQSLSLGVTTQLLLCRHFIVFTARCTIFWDLNLTTLNASTPTLQIRHSKDVLNVLMDMHGSLPALEPLWAKHSRTDCVHVLVIVSKTAIDSLWGTNRSCISYQDCLLQKTTMKKKRLYVCLVSCGARDYLVGLFCLPSHVKYTTQKKRCFRGSECDQQKSSHWLICH